MARRPRIAPVLAVALAAWGLALGLWAAGALTPLQDASVDARFALRSPRSASGVAVVDIDAATLRRWGAWPLRRSVHARAIDRLRRAGVRAIAYDVQFTEPTKPAEDNALIRALQRTPGVVLATTESDGGRTGVLGGDDVVAAVGARAASALLDTDRGAVIRRVPDAVEGLESFSAAAAKQVLGRRFVPSGAGPEGAWIDFAGPPGAVRTVSLDRVLRSRAAAASLRGRVVVVGSSAPSLQDVHPSATSGDEVMSGPVIQANAISTALRGYPLRSAPDWLAALAALVLAGIGAAAVARQRRPALGVAAVVSAAGAWACGAQAAFDAGRVVAFVPPLVSLAAATLAGLGLRLSGEARERRRVRAAFARFVPEAVVDDVLAAAGGGLRLGGVRVDATVMFCDLRGFTTFAEAAPAERVIEVLNRYLSEMSEAILDHGGTLVTYLGDGIMAVFGTPIARPDHADAALAAAREMVEVRLARFNARLAEEGHEAPFALGVGLCSGPVMSGNVGSERRLEYAAIGDTTNVAARLESATKGTPHALYVAASTVAAATDPASVAGLAPVGEVALRGRTGSVEVWAPAGSSPGASGRSNAERRDRDRLELRHP
ncbi:MAG TPA: adenylate/guanylate cyclase domain-containing protein [Solirubrobacteraceae bacterium]|jgi:adenylate cyclase